MRYWLIKSEPGEFGLADLKQRPGQTEAWDGVRNYQARNSLRDDMKKGDKLFFYHSNCAAPGIVGITRVARAAYPDPTAFDPDNKHYDPKSDPRAPRWYQVDVSFERELARTLTLRDLKRHPQALAGLALIARGNRLSVMPVAKKHWDFILSLEQDHA